MTRKIATSAALGVYVAGVAAAIWLATRGGGALPAITRIVLLSQCIVAACAAPFFAAAGEAFGVKSAWRALLRTGVLVVAGLFGAFAGVLLAGTTIPASWLLASAGILLSFAAALVGISTLAASLLLRPAAGQITGYVVAALMLGTVFYANPAVANTRGAAKMLVMQAAIAANPMITMAGSAVDYDVMIGRRSDVSLYYNSLIGPDHLYSYPRWWAAGLIYFAAGGVFTAAAEIWRRHSGISEERY